MKRFTLLVLGLLLCSLLDANAKAAEPVLMKAVLHTRTNNDDKDHDTAIWLQVKTADGDTLLAEAGNHETSTDDSKQYKDGSEHDLKLDVNANLDKSACRGFKVHMWQETHGGRGHDTWKFDAKVTLIFSDKSELTAEITGVTLESKGESDRPAVDFKHAG